MPHATVRWLGGMKFEGNDSLGHRTLMEAHQKYGGLGDGTTPMDLFLIALGGCAGIDIVTMLGARGQQPESLEMAIDGERREEYPKFFSKISIRFTIKGDLDDNVVERVVRLTMTKVCPIAAMLSKIAEVTWSYEIIR
ncbi:MAG: OsmC family protein [Candidatus Verstraetearchaeota archaeon]|nr:OsmC family protein [Candidatus Verstraetearchaeota archaeon]